MGSLDFNKAFDTVTHKEHGAGPLGKKQASRKLWMGHVRRGITEPKDPAYSPKYIRV